MNKENMYCPVCGNPCEKNYSRIKYQTDTGKPYRDYGFICRKGPFGFSHYETYMCYEEEIEDKK
jgi:hypothetical protein